MSDDTNTPPEAQDTETATDMAEAASPAADEYVSCDGSGSLTATVLAAAVPAFVTVMR